MNFKIPEFLTEMLKEQYGKETTLKIIRRLSRKKKNHFSSQHFKSKTRRNNTSFKPKPNKI